MVFDLYPFIPMINQKLRQEIIEELPAYINTNIENPTRQARAIISLYKLKRVFGLLDSTHVKELHDTYIHYLQLDGKPEKGERKLADDLA